MQSFPTLLVPILLACALAPLRAGTVKIADAIPGDTVVVTASSSHRGVDARRLVDGSGVDDSQRHDDHQGAHTMWHSPASPQATSPAPGIPAAPAWVRFDFKEARPLGACMIWNHNQRNLTERGLRHVRAFVSADGETFEPVLVGGGDTFELPRAKGAAFEPVTFTLPLSGKPAKSVVLLAQDNWGGNIFGLSEVRFLGPVREVADKDVPAPAKAEATEFPFLYDPAANSWTRQVTVALDKPVYGVVEATVTCEGASRTEKFDAGMTGVRRLKLSLPEGKGVRRASTAKVEVVVKGASFEKKTEAAIVAPEKWREMEEVILVCKTHLDIGFSHPVDELIKYYRTGMMDSALKMIDRTDSLPADRQFKWMLPAWAMDLVYNHQDNPVRKERIKKRIEDGHLVWHAFPYTFEVDGSDGEEILRGLHYGTDLSRQFNRPLLAAGKMTDAPSHGWVTPTLLKHAGLSLLQVGCNFANPEIPVPMIFWWEGPDGSRLLTMFSSLYAPGLGYGTSPIPPDDWKHTTWLDLEVTIDNSGPPSPQTVDAWADRIRKAIPGVRVRFGDMDDFANKLLKEDLSDLRVIRADMPDTWIHGFMTLPDAAAKHRRSTGELATWGALDAFNSTLGLPRDPEFFAKQRYAYDQSAYYAEHTWGLSGPRVVGEAPLCYGDKWKKLFEAGAYKKYDAEFQVHGDYARRAMVAAEAGVSGKMTQLAAGVAVNGPRVVVFNPLPTARTTEVTVDLPGAGAWVDAETGKSVPSAIRDGKRILSVADLPAGGYRTLVPVRHTISASAEVALSGNTLETARFKAVFDLDRGGISSLTDKATGRELVDASRHALGQFMHERFDRDQAMKFVRSYVTPRYNNGYHGAYDKAGMPLAKDSPYLVSTPAKWTAKAERDELGYRVTLTAGDTVGLAKGYRETFTFPDAESCVDVSWSVTDKTPNPIPEGGWLCFPFKVEQPAFRVGRSGAPIDPAKDIVSGTNRHLIAVDTGITVRSGAQGAGLAVSSPDLLLWSLGEPGLWKFSRDYTPTKPELFVNLYNNMWNTNFRPWQDGSWSVSVRVWPVAQNATEEAALFTPSWNLRQPAVAAFVTGAAGKLPSVSAGLALSRHGVRVMAFGQNPDAAAKDTTILRVWEQAGTAGDLTVTLPAGAKFTTATPVDGRGVPLEGQSALKIENGKFVFPLRAYGIASFVLR